MIAGIVNEISRAQTGWTGNIRLEKDGIESSAINGRLGSGRNCNLFCDLLMRVKEERETAKESVSFRERGEREKGKSVCATSKQRSRVLMRKIYEINKINQQT